MRKAFKVKEWFLRKAQQQATPYNIFMDYARGADGTMLVEDGFATIVAEKVAETEKAVKLTVESGSVVGSSKGWTLWVPKSVMA